MSAVETVKQFLEAFGKGDLETAFSMCSEDMHLDWPVDPRLAMHAGASNGKAEFRRRVGELLDAYVYRSFTLVQVFGDDRNVAVRTEIGMTSRRTGREILMRTAEFWTVEDGLITGLIECYDTALAIEAHKPAA